MKGLYSDFSMSEALISKRIKENQAEKKVKVDNWKWAVEHLRDINFCESQKYEEK